jgi:hypothetical protein
MVRQCVELLTTVYQKAEAQILLETWKRIIEDEERVRGIIVLNYACSIGESYEKDWRNGWFSMVAHYRPTFMAIVNKHWSPYLEHKLRRLAWARTNHLDSDTYTWRLVILRADFEPYTFAFDVEAQRLRNIDI